jgi:hypothetical protein
MEFKIRDEILNKENISKGEFFTLLVGYFADKISDVYISQLKNKYLVDNNNEITGNGIEIVERVLVDSEYYDDKVNFDELAEIIRSKFPEGNKLGTGCDALRCRLLMTVFLPAGGTFAARFSFVKHLCFIDTCASNPV